MFYFSVASRSMIGVGVLKCQFHNSRLKNLNHYLQGSQRSSGISDVCTTHTLYCFNTSLFTF